MAWLFGRDKPRSKVVIAEGLWIKCDSCKEIVYRAEGRARRRVCPKCHYPFRISARERIALLLDPGSFEERDAGLPPSDPLGFKDNQALPRPRRAAGEDRREDAVVSGVGRIGGSRSCCASSSSRSWAAAWARWSARSSRGPIELAIASALPVIIVSPRAAPACRRHPLADADGEDLGGARAAGRGAAALLSVLTDPTTGGVTASFAMLGDVILAEPRALIGFAGPRVIAETIRQPLPEGFQRSEFLLEHGMLDLRRRAARPQGDAPPPPRVLRGRPEPPSP